MAERNVPFALADPNAPVYNGPEWQQIQAGIANREFTPVEIKALYVVGLVLEIGAGVDMLLRASDRVPRGDSIAWRVFTSGGGYLPAYALFASGVELLGRCLTGNEEPKGKEDLRAGFHYLAKPSRTPRLSKIPGTTQVVSTSRRSYTVQDLIDLRNYVAHGQSTTRRGARGRRIPLGAPGVDNDLLSCLRKKMGDAMETYWASLQDIKRRCRMLGKARIDPYCDRTGPLEHVIRYFGQEGHPSVGSLFENHF